jgi:ribosomal protein L7/L12
MNESVQAASISPTLILVLIVTVGLLAGAFLLRRRKNENISVEYQALPRRQPLTPGTTQQLDPEEIKQLAAQDKIEAIKLVRERTGMGLRDAKEYVEGLGLDQPAPLPPSPAATGSADLDTEVRHLVTQGAIIEAIKLVRERTGLGLKEAKDYVDRLR